MSLPDRSLAGQLVGYTLDNGRYKLVKSLGLGTYGEVYLAHDRLALPASPSEFKAIKCIPTRGFAFTDIVQQLIERADSMDDRIKHSVSLDSTNSITNITATSSTGEQQQQQQPQQQCHHHHYQQQPALVIENIIDLPSKFPRGSVRQKVSRLNEEIRLHLKVPPHPNVVRLHRVLHINDVVFMIMDYIPGGDLYENIVNHPSFKSPVWPDQNEIVRDVFLQIAQAIAHCHKHGVYHRDIKPENVCLIPINKDDVNNASGSNNSYNGVGSASDSKLFSAGGGSASSSKSSSSAGSLDLDDIFASATVHRQLQQQQQQQQQLQKEQHTAQLLHRQHQLQQLQQIQQRHYGQQQYAQPGRQRAISSVNEYGRTVPRFHVKIIDFGLATDRPYSNEIGCGSAYYMDPHCQGGIHQDLTGYYTAPNDVWALGVILVNLASGRNPWNQATLTDPIFTRFYMDRSFLRQALPLTDQFAHILSRVFTIEPENRITLPELYALVASCPRFMNMPDTTPPVVTLRQPQQLQLQQQYYLPPPSVVPAAHANKLPNPQHYTPTLAATTHLQHRQQQVRRVPVPLFTPPSPITNVTQSPQSIPSTVAAAAGGMVASTLPAHHHHYQYRTPVMQVSLMHAPPSPISPRQLMSPGTSTLTTATVTPATVTFLPERQHTQSPRVSTLVQHHQQQCHHNDGGMTSSVTNTNILPSDLARHQQLFHLLQQKQHHQAYQVSTTAANMLFATTPPLNSPVTPASAASSVPTAVDHYTSPQARMVAAVPTSTQPVLPIQQPLTPRSLISRVTNRLRRNTINNAITTAPTTTVIHA